MRVELDNGNAIIESDGIDFRVVIPSKKNIFIIFFLCAWLGGWAIGEFSVLAILLSGGVNPFLLFWLIGWTVGGGFAILVVSWMLFGKEIISSDGRYLKLEKCVLIFRASKEYDIEDVLID